MTSKTRLILIGVILAAALFFLWPTFRYYQLDNERTALGKGTPAQQRWDSLNMSDFRAIGAKRLKLGLDLRGGIYLTMEVDAPALLLESAQSDAVDETFEKVIAATRAESLTSDEPVIDIFRRNFNTIAAPQGRSLLNYYDFGDLGANVNDDAIIDKLAKNIDDAVDQAVEVMRQRLDKFGVSEMNLQEVGGRRVIIELPGVTDETEIRSLLQTTARLEFKLVKNDAAAAELFRRIDDQLAGKVSTADTTKADTTGARDTTIAKVDTTKRAPADTTGAVADTARGADSVPTTAKADTTPGTAADTGNPYANLPEAEQAKAYQRDHPFTTLFMTRFSQTTDAQPQDIAYLMKTGYPAGEYYFTVPNAQRKQIMSLLQRSDVQAIFPEDLIIAFSANPEIVDPADPENSFYGMYVLTREPELTGEVVSDARPDFDPQTGRPVVSMAMSADGSAQWADITGRNIKKRVAIVLDSLVYSAPVVQNKISGGSSQITGSSDPKEANLLAVVLKAGALKAPIKIIEERIVGPSLGEDSIQKGVWSTIIATLLVFLFMAIYYRFAGLVANAALLFNIILTMAVLAALQATLTLPGIGGLVLTIGMAVDGNILIYERIREELAAGRSLKTAIQQGYDKAWSAVLDTHITTLITGAILYIFGSGPIQGFAITLMIGLTATLFTSVFVTRTVFALMIDRGAQRIDFGQSNVPLVEAGRATKPA